MEKKDTVFPVSGLEGKKRVHKQHKQRSDKGVQRKIDRKCKAFSIQIDSDLMDYIANNKGDMSRNQFINLLIRKGAGL